MLSFLKTPKRIPLYESPISVKQFIQKEPEMNTYDAMLEKAVVINSLRGEDIFGIIAELTEALIAAGRLDESKRDEAKQAIVRREMSASTVMTDEIALPHDAQMSLMSSFVQSALARKVSMRMLPTICRHVLLF